MMRGLNSFGHGGGKPAGKEGEPTFTRETYSMRERPRTRRISVRGVQSYLIWGLRSRNREVLLPPSCGFPPNLPHRKYFRRGPRSFPLKRGPTILGETFGATRLTLRVTIAGPLVRARGRPRTAPPRRRHVMPLAMRPRSDQMAHCWRTPVQPSALTRSPPTFKRRQSACEGLTGRLHSERDNVVSSDVTLGVFVNTFLFKAWQRTV